MMELAKMYKATGNVIRKLPVRTPVEGGTSLEVGFPIAKLSEYADGQGEAVAELLNRGEAYSAIVEEISALVEEIQGLKDREKKLAEDAYLAGFEASGEGWNGGYGPEALSNALWLANRNEAVAALLSAKKDPHPLASFPDGLNPGLYIIHWKSGGTSEAAIGMMSNGTRWIAPTNWISPGQFPSAGGWADIERAEPIKVQQEDIERQDLDTLAYDAGLEIRHAIAASGLDPIQHIPEVDEILLRRFQELAAFSDRVSDEFRQCITEIFQWHKTGVLSGEAVRNRARAIRAKFNDSFDMGQALMQAEEEVKREAMRILVTANRTEAERDEP